MKKIANLVSLEAVIVMVLCLSLVTYPQMSVSGAIAFAAADLKTESQYRGEAARYEGAIRAISGIATMKLETGDDLKKAIAILDRERPNLKLFLSKLIVVGLNDSTFSGAVKKRATNKQAAEAFGNELKVDRGSILKLDGAQALKTRMQNTVASDAAVLRRAGERLKEASERIKKAGQRVAAPDAGLTGKFKVIRAVYSPDEEPFIAPALSPMLLTDPLTIALIIVACVIVDLIVSAPWWGTLVYVFVDEAINSQDEVAACQRKADDGYTACLAAANDLPSGFPFFQRETATGLCYADWLFEQSVCLLEYL